MFLPGVVALTLAQAAAVTSTAPAAIESPTQPVKICRDGGRNLGTHMRKGRVCKTADEWAEEKKGGNYIPSMTIRRTQDKAIEGLPKPGCC